MNKVSKVVTTAKSPLIFHALDKPAAHPQYPDSQPKYSATISLDPQEAQRLSDIVESLIDQNAEMFKLGRKGVARNPIEEHPKFGYQLKAQSQYEPVVCDHAKRTVDLTTKKIPTRVPVKLGILFTPYFKSKDVYGIAAVLQAAQILSFNSAYSANVDLMFDVEEPEDEPAAGTVAPTSADDPNDDNDLPF